MDGGPFRVPRPTDRRVAGRPEAAPRQPEEVQPVKEEPKIVHRAAASHRAVKEKKSFKRFLWPMIAIIIVVVLMVVGWMLWSNGRGTSTAIDGSKYQAVFFTNGQVYFGKLHAFDDDYMKLTDVFYLQTKEAEADSSKNLQKTAESTSSDVQLIKLGNEIHGPSDEMIISKDQMLFFENLKSDGKVSNTIDQYNKTNKK